MAHVVLDWFRHTPAMIEKIVLISTEMCTPHAPTTSTGRGVADVDWGAELHLRRVRHFSNADQVRRISHVEVHRMSNL